MTTQVHAEPTWRKSSYSNATNGDCVEMAIDSAAVDVRDSKSPENGALDIGRPQWQSLLLRVRGM